MDLAIALNDQIIKRLNESDLRSAIQGDGALRIKITGDLRGGTVDIDIPNTNLAKVDAVLKDGLAIRVAAGVDINQPIHYQFMTGQVTFTGLMGIYTFSITLC